MEDLDGLEIYNRHWDAKKDRVTLLALVLKLTNPREVAILQEALVWFPDELREPRSITPPTTSPSGTPKRPGAGSPVSPPTIPTTIRSSS